MSDNAPAQNTGAAQQLSAEKQALLALRRLRAKLEESERLRTEPIAIIGMGCRFPGGASSPELFWQMLRDGRNAVSEVPPDRWDADAFHDVDPDAVGKMVSRHGGFLSNVDQFDPQFFGISPREAEKMDPQQRLLLEVSWEALEHAGQAADRLAGSRTGVFVGMTGSDYFELLRQVDPAEIDAYCMTGTAPNFAAGRLSYFLGLQGPSMTIDTACSSSLVALHLACQSLRSGECRMAIVGGTNVILLPENNVLLSKAHMLAPDGRCKTFDAAADGYVRGEGCGVVVLKRLSDADADRDRVCALIRGSAVNQDGRSSGLTVPSGPAQESLIREALASGRVEAGEIAYVEAHGSGTSLGDPIEIRALNAALCQGRGSERPLLVGAVKTNVGHLEAAAGMAGVIKTVLALQHGEIPPHLHVRDPNPHIPWSQLPIKVATAPTSWPAGYAQRLAGVSSFGASGTNAHVVLEGAGTSGDASAIGERRPHVIAVSAKSPSALRQLAGQWSERLREHTASIHDVAFTATAGRAHLSHRVALVASDTREASDTLAAFAAGVLDEVATGVVSAGSRPKVAFLFTGQGSQYVDMGRKLYETEPVFREALDRCLNLSGDMVGPALRAAIFPERAGDSTSIDRTANAQPALFALEYALATLLDSWGIRPAAVTGHSVGAYAAACIARILELEDAVRLITARGRLMQALSQDGTMAAVFADEARVTAAIEPHRPLLSIAAINGPENIVISGAHRALDDTIERLVREGVRCERLAVSHAFHSHLMEPMLGDLERIAAAAIYAPAQIAVVSDLTGQLLGTEEMSAAYWRRHAREPVRFAAAVQTLYDRGCRVFVEIGPKPTLSGMGRTCLPEDARWIATLRKGRDDRHQLLAALGELYTAGVDVDWDAVESGDGRRKVALPTYPFERQRFWVHTTSNRSAIQGATGAAVESLHDCLYEVEWRAKPSSASVRAPLTFPAPVDLARAVEPSLATLAPRTGLAAFWELRPQLEVLCSSFVLRAFADLGWDPESEPRVSPDDLRARAGVLDRHQRLFDRMFDILAEDELVRRDGPAWEVTARPRSIGDPAATVQNLLARYPESSGEISLTDRCGRQLADVLRGRVNPMDVLFPQGSLEQLARVYQDAPSSRVFNTLIRETLRSAIGSLPARRRVRILEIGAGTGGTAAGLLPELDAQRVGYTFTDVSRSFLIRAEERFAAYPFVDYRLLDIGVDPRSQGFEPHSFDIILASHVLHATPDLRRSLRHISDLLASDGLLVLLEGTTRHRFLDLTFGLTEGWWNFTDTDLRSYALLSSPEWVRLLESAGFKQAAGFADRLEPHESGAAIIVASGAHVPAAPAIRTDRPGSWLVLADEGGTADPLVERIKAQGDRCQVVTKGEGFQALPNDRVVVNPYHAADFHRLIAAAVADRASLQGIVHCWALDERTALTSGPQDLDRSQHRACGSVLYLAQALTAARLESLPALTIVSRGGQAVGDTKHGVEPAHAMAWGLAKVIGREHPELRCACVDLDPGSLSHADVADLLHEDVLAPSDTEEQVAIRNGERYVARLVRSNASLAAASRWRLHSDASYLITGGLGAVGLLAAQRLVERGARHVVLLGRSAPSPAAETAIERLEETGATVQVLCADIADREALSQLVEQLRSDGTPLRGVIHAAVAIDDALLPQQTWERFQTVMRAKVQGAWNLHAVTSPLPLDFFVLFSSASSLLGPPGLGNYAAANTFVDALAHHRRAKGLPASSINWGPWSGVGVAGISGVLDRAKASGVRPIASEQALDALELLVSAKKPQVGVIRVNWSEMFDARRESEIPPLLSELAADTPRPRQVAAPVTVTLLQKLEDAPRHRRWNLLLEYVREQASQVLRIDQSSPVDAQAGLRDLGLDSLMALELRNRLQKGIGQPLRSTLAFDYPTIDAIARHLAADVLALDLDDAQETKDGENPTGSSDLLFKLEQLSDEQADALFAERISAHGN